MIAAVATGNFAIGYSGGLCYRIREDMIRFKELTMGHTIIMGYNTYKSLPGGALSGRRNIVLTDENELQGCDVFITLEGALSSCNEDEEVFIIGGGQLFKSAYNLSDTLYLTEVFDTPTKCDVFFPPYFGEFYCIDREYHVDQGLRYEFTKYIREQD